MVRKSFYIILLLLAVLTSAGVHAVPVNTDATLVRVTIPSNEKIKSYKNDSDFNYKTTTEPQSESLVSRIMEWIFKLLDKLFSNEGAAPFIRYGIIAALIIFIVLRLMNVRPQSLFYKNRQQKSNLLVREEMEIAESDLDAMIAQEISNNNFRLATRYLYLKLLKILNNKEFIEMQIQKTNYDYYNEMRKNPLSKDFGNLSNVFEFVWYGDFAVEKEIFTKIHGDFNSIFTKLND